VISLTSCIFFLYSVQATFAFDSIEEVKLTERQNKDFARLVGFKKLPPTESGSLSYPLLSDEDEELKRLKILK
jgi:hypothetical protein